MVTEVASKSSATELTALDRCDACGAQAYVRVTTANGPLFFCAHHASQHKSKLEPIATDWHDETYRLTAENA